MKNKYKTLITIFITVFLGAVGSGIWQYVLNPALEGSTRFLLEIGTLGVETFKNELYIEVSKGYQETASFKTLSILSLIIGLLSILLCAKSIVDAHFAIKKHGDLLKDIELLEQGKKEEPRSITEIKNDLILNNPKSMLKSAYMMIPFAGMLIIILTISTASDRYVNNAVAHYNQILKVASPYMTHEEILQIESEFAQISSSEDYIKVTEKLYQYTNEAEIEVNHFDIW